MKRVFTAIFLLSQIICLSQISSPENRIVVLGQSSIQIPANRAIFTLQLNAQDNRSMDSAYIKMEALEKSLNKLVEVLKLPKSNVKSSFLQVSKRENYRQNCSDCFVNTCNKYIALTIDSIDLIEKIQKLLIENGIYNFSSSLFLKDNSKIKKEALEKAVLVAKDKAAVLAKASNRKIKRIIKITDTEETDPRFNNYSNGNNGNEQNYGVINSSSVPNNIAVSASIKVVFELE